MLVDLIRDVEMQLRAWTFYLLAEKPQTLSLETVPSVAAAKIERQPDGMWSFAYHIQTRLGFPTSEPQLVSKPFKDLNEAVGALVTYLCEVACAFPETHLLSRIDARVPGQWMLTFGSLQPEARPSENGRRRVLEMFEGMLAGFVDGRKKNAEEWLESELDGRLAELRVLWLPVPLAQAVTAAAVFGETMEKQAASAYVRRGPFDLWDFHERAKGPEDTVWTGICPLAVGVPALHLVLQRLYKWLGEQAEANKSGDGYFRVTAMATDRRRLQANYTVDTLLHFRGGADGGFRIFLEEFVQQHRQFRQE